MKKALGVLKQVGRMQKKLLYFKLAGIVSSDIARSCVSIKAGRFAFISIVGLSLDVLPATGTKSNCRESVV